MIDEIDYQYFFENIVNVERLKWSSNQGTGRCPLPNHEDRNPSWTCTCDTGQWNCHSCGESGNAYTLAKILHLDSPEQYLTIGSDNDINSATLANTRLKTTKKHHDSESKTSISSEVKIDLTDKAEEFAENLGENYDKEYYSQSIGYYKGGIVFPYFNKDDIVDGLKYHKPNLHTEGNMSKRWYLEWMLEDYDKDKPLIIAEGEKDALKLIVQRYQAISGSAGCDSVPSILPIFQEFKEIIIVYDNDEAGRKGAKKLAKHVKKDASRIIVKIVQWSQSYPNGYDVYQDWEETGGDGLDDAINNAIEYKHEIPEKIGVFSIMLGKEASEKEPKPTEWLVENVLPKEFNSCIAGTTGAKKSFWAMQLGMCLANGENFFCGNRIKSKELRVLYVDTEIGLNEMHRRYKRIKRKLNWKGDNNFLMISKGGTHIDIWDDVHKVLSYYKPELIIIDSLYNSTTVGDFSKSAQMSKVTNALSGFKERYNVTLLAVAHFNKGQHEQGLMIDRMQGSAVLQNWIEFQMLMISTNVDDFNLWTVGKTRGVRHDKSIIGLHWDDFWFTTEGVVDDYKPFLITEHKKIKWQSVLEDCPDKFDSKQWLNVFSSKYSMSDRTGRQWLKECSESPMLEKLAHDIYEKKLKLINESSFD